MPTLKPFRELTDKEKAELDKFFMNCESSRAPLTAVVLPQSGPIVKLDITSPREGEDTGASPVGATISGSLV